MSNASVIERLAVIVLVLGVLWGGLSVIHAAVAALYAAILRPLAGF